MRRIIYIFLFFASSLFYGCSKLDLPRDNPLEGNAKESFQEIEEETERQNISSGAILSAFSVSDTSQVFFSMGNLQYQPSSGTWKFAEQQYNAIGRKNASYTSTYNGWIDMFCWATSGWIYQPYEIVRYYDEVTSNELIGDYANADWGIYNAIVNGGNKIGIWRTLTSKEWDYLINSRQNAKSKYGVGCINGINGLIILPDKFEWPKGPLFECGVYEGKSDEALYYKKVNSYSLSEWAKIEANGAVFLPVAGGNGMIMGDGYNIRGGYWSSSSYDVYTKKYLSIRVNDVRVDGDNNVQGIDEGTFKSVRLVQNVK